LDEFEKYAILESKNILVCQTIYTAIWDFVFIAEVKHWDSQLPEMLLTQYVGARGAIILGYQ
jgi:hypothetical protein